MFFDRDNDETFKRVTKFFHGHTLWKSRTLLKGITIESHELIAKLGRKIAMSWNNHISDCSFRLHRQLSVQFL